MKYFVQPGSIVRKIWGKSDTILFIFSGAAAEFALNKAVDWLYFTGRLPADPIGRLFSTVSYARQIVFASEEDALIAIDKITSIHASVEKSRASKIPDWAYRDVLFMLIYYSIAAHELLEGKLTETEKEEVYSLFLRIGERMQIPHLPQSYTAWLPVREQHLKNDLAHSRYTTDLFRQYKKNLGTFRYHVVKEGQRLVIPKTVLQLLNFRKFSFLTPIMPVYKLSRRVKLDWLIKELLLPQSYKAQIRALDVITTKTTN